MLCLRCGVGKTLLEDLSGGVPNINISLVIDNTDS